MDRCALVTGGTRNIGRGIAVVLAKHGYDVAITYATNKEGADETKRQIEALGRKCHIYEAHLEKADAPERTVEQAYADMGRLDLMVCNAGKEIRGSVMTFTAEDYDFLYSNNLRNYLLCAGAAARRMVKTGTMGSIVMVTSVRANLAHPDDFYYGGLKAAMERACKSMALDLSEFNIRVNCVAPGAIWNVNAYRKAIETPFVRESIPLHRTGTPEDIGEAVAYLADERASYITGITLLVDGGLSLPGLLEREETIPWKQEGWSEKRYNKAMEILSRTEGEE